MLNLNIYKIRDIQNTISILSHISNNQKGMTIAKGLNILETFLAESVKKVDPLIKESVVYHNQVKRLKCPSCKKGYLIPTFNYENLNIVSCKKCRYSKILEEESTNG